MSTEEISIQLKDDFYRDSFFKVFMLIVGVLVAIGILILTAVYLWFDKPRPITFPVDIDWRVQAPVPLNQPYLTTPDLLQWVGDVIPKAFQVDFENYNDQIKATSKIFTDNGYKAFLTQLNLYANATNVQNGKLFVTGSPNAAPFILKSGLLGNRYGWWVQLPINFNYEGVVNVPNKTITFQILVVRVPTVNNLTGVAIDNIIVAPPSALNQ